MVQDNIGAVYTALQRKNITNLGTQEEFAQRMQNKENRKLVYDKLSTLGFSNLGTYDEFEARFATSSDTASESPTATDAPKPAGTSSSRQRMDVPAPLAERGENKTVNIQGLMYNPSQQTEQPASEPAKQVPQSTARPKEETAVYRQKDGGEPELANGEQKKTVEELMQMRNDAKEDYDFVAEYEKREKDLKEKMKSLSSIRGDVRGSNAIADYNSDKAWLEENKDKYDAAKKTYDSIESQIANDQVPEAKENLAAAIESNRMAMPEVSPLKGSGSDPFGRNYAYWKTPEGMDLAYREAADNIYGQTEQVLNQGSKYDKGYEGSDLEKAWTAVRQYIEGGANNFDLAEFGSMGLSKGSALAKAREVLQHNNDIVTDALKEMKMSDADINAVLSSIEVKGRKLSELDAELKQENAEINTMKATLDDMVKSGASRGEIEAYARQFDKRVDEYNKRISKEYDQLRYEYDKDYNAYKAVMDNINAAVESKLSGGEKAVIDAIEQFTRAKMLRANDVSKASEAGAGFEQTLEFMLDFILTGGMGKAGTKAATKLTMRRLEKKLGKQAVAEMAAKQTIRPSLWHQILTDMGVATGRTIAMAPRVASTYGEQVSEFTGKDEAGRYQFARSEGDALVNAGIQDFIEYWSEGFGEYFGALESRLFRNVTGSAPKTAIGQTLRGYKGSVGRFLDNGKFNGMFNETMEEVVGSGLNSLVGWMSNDRYGDKEAMKNFFDLSNLATLTMSFLPLSAIGAATNINSYNKMKQRYDASVEGLQPFVDSGAISREELDHFAANLTEMTPKEVKDKIVDMTDRARAKNGGRLPQDFAKNIMGYLEGTFSMSLQSEEWEASQEKMAIVNAYTANYANPTLSRVWDANDNESSAEQEALNAGFTEDELGRDAYILGQEAVAMRVDGKQERADILMNYATAKAQAEGLRRGYAEQTKQVSEAMDESVRANLDTNGRVIEGVVTIEGNQVPVYVVQKDATVNADGTISTPTGDGEVMYFNKVTGRKDHAKADAFSAVKATQTDQYIANTNAEAVAAREEAYRKAESTISPAGMAKAVAARVGQTVFVDNHQGVYEPVVIERMTNEGATAVISAQNKSSMQTVARALGLPITGSTNMKVSTDALYNALAKDAEQNITTQMPETAPEVKEQAEAVSENNLEDLIDTDVAVSFNGKTQNVHVDDVNDGMVNYTETDAKGKRRPRRKSVADFQKAMQAAVDTPVAEEQTPAPAVEETPASAAQEEVVPKQGTIPRDEKGRKVYDAEGVSVEDALDDLYKTPGLTEEKVDQYIADRAAKAEAARNPEMGDMTPEEWGAATMEADRVADFWAAMKQAAEQRKQQPVAPAQEETPINREAAQAPQTEEMTEQDRSKLGRRLARRLKRWEKRTGVKVRVINSIDEVTDPISKAALEEGRPLTGWYLPETNEVELYAPNIASEAELDASYIHEVVAHRGLRGLLGEEGYNALCDRVWNELMTEGDKSYYLGYNRHLELADDATKRAAADEYIARLSENLDFYDNRSLLQKIVDWVKRILGEELSVEDYETDAAERAAGATPKMTDDVLRVILSDSMKRYVEQTRRGQQDAEQKREIGSNVGNAIETDSEHKGQTRFSMKSIVTGGGLNVIEDDGKGNVAFVTTDGRTFNADNPITADDLKGLGNTVMAHMMKDAREISHIDPQKEMRIWQAYADQLNAFLKKGVAKDGLDGADRLKALWQWEVENSVYRSVAPNSDEQYKYSLDITRVCKKNEATIKAISAMQRQLGYGITPGQVMDVYLSAIEEGYQVPCPVCYVFSRYINNGVVATIAINGQRRWGKDLVDPSTLTEEQRKERIAMWKKRLDEQEAFNDKYAKQIAQAKTDCTNIIEEIDRLSKRITSGELKGKERAAAEKRVKLLDNRYRAAFDLVSQSALTQWIKQFAIRQTKNGYAPAKDGKKYDLWGDTFQGFPDEYALDLRLTAETIEKYPAIQRLRKARGAAGGKEIHFASNNDVGDVPMMLGADNSVNFYQKAVNARTQKERDYFLGKARERFQSAHKYAQQQSLRGGQRMWSWSDNIERLAPDVFVNLLQLQMLGGALQSYSKQLEGVNLVANMDGYVNGSLMGYGKGWTELKPEDVEYIEVNGEKVPVLSHDIKDVVEEKMPEGVVMRERYLAKKGAPVTAVDGKMVTLLFDDVVGIDAYGRDVDGKHLKGLFDLNGELDKAGNILVGMNDTHIIAAMADDRVFFIIPWHASGNSVHMVQQMLRGLGVDTMVKDYTDYTNVQEEKDMAGKKKGGEEAEFADEIEEVSKEEKIEESEPIRQEILDFWEDHKKEDKYRSGIGPIPSGKDGKLSDEQRRYRRLRDAIFDGTVSDLSEEDRKAITDDAFLSQVLRKVNAVVDAKEMTAGDKKFIYPYEYWNENRTYDTADENGERYLEYCRRLGYKPKFVGKLDSKAKKDFGNFAGYKGYWKLLIDRRMYGVNGRFQDLDPVTTDRYDPRTVDPEWAAENFPLTTVADDPGAERIAARAIEKESRTFKGGVPKPNYEGDIKSAARKYEMVSKLVDVKPGKGKNTMFRVADEMRNGDASADPQVSEGGVTMFRERTAPAPKNRQKVYKLMRLGDDGKLYPLFIDSATPIELGRWWDADSPALKDVENLPSDTYTGKRDIKDKDGNKIGEEEYKYASYIVDNETGEAMSIADFKASHKGFGNMQGNPNKKAINWATENGMRWIRIEEKKTAQKRYGGSNRAYYNYGINGSNAVGTYAMRPGWHAGSLPSMRQIGKGKGKNLRDDRFVWVEGYVPADIDYNEEAQGNPDKDIPTHIPENGYYLKATNANAEASQADRIGWYVAGSFFPERIISDSEAKAVIDGWNAEHPNETVEYDWPRESGKVFNADTMQLEDPDKGPDGNGGGTRFRETVTPEQDAEYMDAVNSGDMEKAGRMVRDAFKAAFPNTKVVDENGEPLMVFHGAQSSDLRPDFYEFSVEKMNNGRTFGDGYYFTSSKELAEKYAKRLLGSFDNGTYEKYSPRVIPAYLNIENMVDVEAGEGLRNRIREQRTRIWNEIGRMYDGLVVRDIKDGYDIEADTYLVRDNRNIKSAEPVTYDEDGKVIPLSKRFDAKNSDIRFREANQNQLGFVSNAEAALDRIKMDKATPEQWQKMLEKEGGMKAGEDKWLGLSDWLASQDKKSITKDEVADYIAEHRIQIEDVNYFDNFDMEKVLQEDIRNRIGRGKSLDEIQKEVDELVASDEYKNLYDNEEQDNWLLGKMVDRYGDDFEVGYFIDEMQKVNYNVDQYDLPNASEYNQTVADNKAIHSIRKNYTTSGLKNKREIALTVPTIEPWNESDGIHFGDAGNGRAVAWVRFGDTNTKPEGKGYYSRSIMDELEKKYGDSRAYDKMTDEDAARAFFADYVYRGAEGNWNDWYKDVFMKNSLGEERTERVYPIFEQMVMEKENPGNRVLVIDEIQSKRHQEGREKGYKSDEEVRDAKELDGLENKYRDKLNALREKYNTTDSSKLQQRISDDERKELSAIYDRLRELRDKKKGENDGVAPAPFEKNWHELAMKRMLRLAAEEGYDYVAWTTGDQQAERYNIGNVVNSIEVSRWGEDANGYYLDEELGKNARSVLIDVSNQDRTIELICDKNGQVVDGWSEYRGKNLSEIVGKELAKRLLSAEGKQKFGGENLRFGADGMKGFYDDILPRFMNKYGKKWGVKVEDITLPNVEEAGRVMHAVPVTPEMKESVMRGQTMFREGKRPENGGIFKGRPFWSGSVNLLDGVIEEVHSYEDAEANDFHHSFYFSDPQIEKMANGENAFFWVDEDGEINGEWRTTIEDEIINRIKEQIEIRNPRNTRFREAPPKMDARAFGFGDLRFREAGGEPANVAYEDRIRKITTNILLEFQDGDIPARIAINNIMNEVGKEHLAEDEDYLTRHNLVSSMADAQMHKFKLFYFEPLVKTIGKIEEKLVGKKPYFWRKHEFDDAYGRVKNYIYAVSALERNEWKRNEADKKKMDAIERILEEKSSEINRVRADRRIDSPEALNAALDRIEEKYDKKYRETLKKYEDRDYSGITALMGYKKEEWRKAEAEARAMVEEFRNTLGDSASLLDELWDRLRACTDFNLEFAYKYGLLTRAEYERLHGTESQPRLWDFYVPLRGFAERTAEDEYGYRSFVSSDTGDAVAKKAKGRSTEADDPIANIQHIAELGIVQALQNWSKQALYNFVLTAGDNSLLTPIEPWFMRDSETGDWVIVEPNKDESLDAFEERMEGLQAEQPDNFKHERTGLKLGVIMGKKEHRNEHMIRLKVRGVDKGIWVHGDNILAKAVNGGGGIRFEIARRIKKFNRALAQLYTTLSVNFLVKNKQRDTQFSRIAALVDEDQKYLATLEKNWWANNGYIAGGYPMMRLVKEWESGKLEKKENLTEREQMFIDFMYDGGATGYTVMNTMEDIKKDLQKMVERAGREQRNISPIALYAKFVGAMNEGGELLTRFTFYQTSRMMGRSRQRAAYDAKESSVNFNRRGLQSGEGIIGGIAAAIGMLYLFFNPAIQGLEKFVRLHKEHPWKMGMVDATYFMMGFVNSMLNAMIAGVSDGGDGDDDEQKMGPDWYWNIPEWVRRSNIIIGSPFKKLGKWGYLVIALPIEYKGFYAMGELASALWQKKYAAKDAPTIANEVVGVVAELLPVNPVEGYTPGESVAKSVLRNLTPDVIAPISDVANNRSFAGIPLWKESVYDENQPLAQSAFASTPEILNKAVIKMSEVSATWPWHWDYPSGAIRGLLKGYGGGAYTFVENMYKITFADEAHPRRYENFPYISGFTGYLEEDRRNSFNNDALQRYKELSGDVLKRVRSAAPGEDIKMSDLYENPDGLPAKAKLAKIALEDKWRLGKIYYDGMKEKSGAKEPHIDKNGKVRMVDVKDDIKGLRKAWQDAKNEYLKIAKDKNATQEEKDNAEKVVRQAWLKYTQAEDGLVDKLLAQEYDQVQQRLENGLPYEPKETLSEKAYKLTNKKK